MALITAAVYLSICLSIFAGNAYSKEVCHPQPADVIFVLDTSDSINQLNFRKQIDFVSHFISDLSTLNSMGTKVSIYTFSDSFKNNIVLGQYQDKNSLLSLLNGIQRLHGTTETHLVLDDVLKNGFSTSNRQSAKRIVVLITDGQSIFPSKTILAAKALHNAYIDVHTIGVGSNVDPNEIMQIASIPQNSHLVPDYNSLSKIDKELDKLICLVIAPTMNPIEVCTTRPTDVYFVLDSSDSISQKNFDIQINFILDIVSNTNMKISINESQVGIYTFASTFAMNIALGSYNNKGALLKAIKNMARLHGSTNTHLALKDVLQNGYSKHFGARTGVHRVVVLITDGQSVYDTDTTKAADALHNEKIEVIAIGVGYDIYEPELKRIASKYENMHLVSNYSSLQSVLEKHITKITCIPKKVCKVRPTDVIFAIDSSSSISKDDFSKQKSFLVDFAKNTKLVIGDNSVHIGLYTFADIFVQNFRLNSYKTKPDVLKALTTLVRLQGSTNTHLALQDILINGFSASSGARANAHHVLVLITDGQSVYRNKTIEAGKALHRAGIEIYAIYVGNNTDSTELKEIASSKNTFYVPDYHTLDLIEDNINKVICVDATKNQTGTCEYGSADVVFLLDTSDSTKKNIVLETSIISKFVNLINGLNNIQVALITFATKATQQFSLTTHTSKSSLLSALQNLQISSGSTNTAAALKLAKTTLQSGSKYKRQAVILITDGESDYLFNTLQAAEDLRSSGINIFSYGIGRSDISELQLISGSMSNIVIGEVSEVTTQLMSKVLESKCS